MVLQYLILFDRASDSNHKFIQSFQNKMLRNIVNVLGHILKFDLNLDLGIVIVKEEIRNIKNNKKKT